MGETKEKPDYFHEATDKTYKVLLLPFQVIEECVLKTYEHVGNPAASKQQLINVFIRLVKALIR